MTCHECKKRLLEQFGGDALPADVSAHLDGCEECRRLWSELSDLKTEIGTNADSFPESHEAELVAEAVERQIKMTTIATEVSGINWSRSAAVAAALLLVPVGAMLFKMSNRAPQIITKVDTVNVAQDAQVSDFDDELSTGAVATLLKDFTGRSSFSAGEELLGDLTADEAAYLEEQIKAGDLL